MVFPMQNVQDIVNSHKIERFDEIVYSACQKARTDGGLQSPISPPDEKQYPFRVFGCK